MKVKTFVLYQINITAILTLKHKCDLPKIASAKSQFNQFYFYDQGMVKRGCPGYAVGGLSGGEAKDDFWKVVHHCTSLLPRDKPIYVMGVG